MDASSPLTFFPLFAKRRRISSGSLEGGEGLRDAERIRMAGSASSSVDSGVPGLDLRVGSSLDALP